jgi:hypothetical protein
MALMGMIFFDGLRLLCYDFLICPGQIMMVIPPVNRGGMFTLSGVIGDKHHCLLSRAESRDGIFSGKWLVVNC